VQLALRGLRILKNAFICIEKGLSEPIWFGAALRSDGVVVATILPKGSREQALASLFVRLKNLNLRVTKHVSCHEVIEKLEKLFKGSEASLPFSLENVSGFERDVLNVVRHVPRGFVTSYGEVAKAIGKPNASRAVGRALSKNPLPLIIPCHRVVRNDLSLGGFESGIQLKKMLLEREGVKFKGHKVMEEHFLALSSLAYRF